MSDDHLTRICRLIHHSLPPFTEAVLSEENEKLILISLTKASTEIKRFAKQIHSHADNDCGLLSVETHNCLTEILSILVIYLTASSQYIRHSAENILVILSDFLIQSGGKWENFLHLLCGILEEAILNISSSSSTNDWLKLIGLVRVFRNILKSSRQRDTELDSDYILLLSNFLSNVHWDLLHESFVDQTGRTAGCCNRNDTFNGKVGSSKSKDLLLATLLQLFCSLVDLNCTENATDDSFDELPVLAKIRNLIPKLLCWCFPNNENHRSHCLSQYMRHKILVLMTRISSLSCWQCSTLVFWLQLLRKYFEDLLLQVFAQSNSELGDFLEGSPFIESIANKEKVHYFCSHHLQRQAIFLLIKCSITLIGLGNGKCACKSPCPLTHKKHERERCYFIGLSELNWWVQTYVPLEKFLDYDSYLMGCKKFSASFLQFFIDEDDVLFDMLLQLLSSPFLVNAVYYKERDMNFVEAKKDEFFLISSIFNPIHFFHLFLAQLHYDHSVLLDYLISKDTGIQCVQFLLRCLRMVCHSWDIFVEFSVCEFEVIQFPSKKRKLCYLVEDQDPHEKVAIQFSSIDVVRSSDVLSMPGKFRRQAFHNAKVCLLALKQSVENLHAKNLFPYNPTALLKSFTRFEDLCQKEETKHFQGTSVVI